MGNHTWGKRDLYPFLDANPEKIIRPINFPGSAPGCGYTIVNVCGYRVLCINAQGVAFMEPLNDPFEAVEYVLARAGVTFQYSSEITCISYQNRTIEVDGQAYVFRKINPMIWANMLGIEQRDNIAIATPERAFLDMVYLSAGQCYFDNLHPLNKDLVRQILPTYNSKILTRRVEALLKE
jgi:hypothetical protein